MLRALEHGIANRLQKRMYAHFLNIVPISVDLLTIADSSLRQTDENDSNKVNGKYFKQQNYHWSQR